MIGVWLLGRMPELALLGAPFYGPLLMAIPFAMLTAWPVLGLTMARWRMAAIPEEAQPPQALLNLNLAALSARRAELKSLTSLV
jgi:membrane glycosyltransferase